MEMIETALALAARGIHVFPCLPRGKEPAVAGGCKRGTTDVNVIRGWWGAEPDYNIGVTTGAASKIFVVDIDGDAAERELKKLEDQHGTLPRTVTSLTKRGRHLFFSWPNWPVRNSASKIVGGVDVRGEGGYVICPPSIHPSGTPYTWSTESSDHFAPAPAWLLNLISAPPSRNGDAGATTPPEQWCSLIREGVGEGCRNDSIARLVGHLLRHHIDPMVTLEIAVIFNTARCRPPLPDDELLMIVDSIAARELARRGIR